ncbi:MAG: hypothetical protein KDN05_14505 [Verrucomicrobiae bacterium]|nr:hypothetical protein [Verrucomicrobiae bacterium]MCP5548723.1 hypothetical protein [Akkermansiaceae bacterium]
MRKSCLVLLALLVAAGWGGWWFRDPLIAKARSFLPHEVAPPAPRPDPEGYETLKTELERWRRELAARYKAARNPKEREDAVHDARVVLETTLPEMMRCWLGTPWDFNGTAEGPGGGKIACGYFVSTVLRDAGFRLDRYRLARQPSSKIIHSFLPKTKCALDVGIPYDAFAREMETAEPGIYLTGLDTHVAFIVVDSKGFRFIHASGSKPWCVVDEDRDHAGVLQRSKWRMRGNLTADEAVILRWIRGETIVVQGS